MIIVGRGPLSVTDLAEIVIHHKKISLDDAALNEVEINHKFLKKF